MMRTVMVFCWIVGELALAFVPEDFELLLVFAAVSEPCEAHIEGVGHSLFHRTADNSTSSVAISDERCWWLWVA